MLRADEVPILEPCGADWDAMVDHGRHRHCAACDKPVYDLAQHTEAEIRALVAAKACKRVTLRADGTVLTRDEAFVPVARVLRFARAAAIALPLAACDRTPVQTLPPLPPHTDAYHDAMIAAAIDAPDEPPPAACRPDDAPACGVDAEETGTCVDTADQRAKRVRRWRDEERNKPPSGPVRLGG